MEFEPCDARAEFDAGPSCVHPLAEAYKKYVTPEVCNNCIKRVYSGMPMPSLKDKLVTASKSAAAAVRRPQRASKEEVSRRQAICNECEYHTDDNECRVCGCGLTLKKRLKVWRCDLGKWD